MKKKKNSAHKQKDVKMSCSIVYNAKRFFYNVSIFSTLLLTESVWRVVEEMIIEK